MQRDDVGGGEELVEGDEARVQLPLERLVGAAAAAVDDAHAERARPARGGGADLPEADDPEGLALDTRSRA